MDFGRRTALVGITAVLATWVAGCGPRRPTRYQVTGSVTYAGKPVPHGMVSFQPDLATNPKGLQGMATIADGRYVTGEVAGGVPKGRYRVIAYGFDGQNRSEILPDGKRLFDEYSFEWECPGGPQVLDIDVPAAAAH